MDLNEIKRILKRLQDVVEDLECEIYSNKSSYTLDIPYDEVLKYEQVNDDDGDY